MSKNEINLQLFGYAEDDAAEILHGIDREYDHLSADQQIEFAKLAQLKRIADSLNEVSDLLDKFTTCIGINNGVHYLKVNATGAVEITGTIDHY